MRFLSPLLLILCLAACQRGGQNNDEAVRQGVLDHYAKAGINAANMSIKMSTPTYSGNTADVEVSVTPKERPDAPATPFKYHLERQDTKWVVVGRASESHGGAAADPGTNPHGGEMPSSAGGAENPHGAMPGAGGAGKMPSPSDLPPTKK